MPALKLRSFTKPICSLFRLFRVTTCLLESGRKQPGSTKRDHPAPDYTNLPELRECCWTLLTMEDSVLAWGSLSSDILSPKLERESRFLESLLRVVTSCNPIFRLCSVVSIKCRIKRNQLAAKGNPVVPRPLAAKCPSSWLLNHRQPNTIIKELLLLSRCSCLPLRNLLNHEDAFAMHFRKVIAVM